jgi:hypothetical protein
MTSGDSVRHLRLPHRALKDENSARPGGADRRASRRLRPESARPVRVTFTARARAGPARTVLLLVDRVGPQRPIRSRRSGSSARSPPSATSRRPFSVGQAHARRAAAWRYAELGRRAFLDSRCTRSWGCCAALGAVRLASHQAEAAMRVAMGGWEASGRGARPVATAGPAIGRSPSRQAATKARDR